LLENSPICTLITALWSAVMRSVAIGNHACMEMGRFTSTNAGHEPGSTNPMPVNSGGERPLSMTLGSSPMSRCAHSPSSGSTAVTVPERRTA
jgi:hypothetical protein